MDHPTPVTVAVAFTKAWANQDMTTAASYVADDVVFDSPTGRITGIEAYIQALTAFAQRVTGLHIIAALGDDDQALIMYDLTTDPFGILPSGEHLTISDGKIKTDKLVFDTYEMRKGRPS